MKSIVLTCFLIVSSFYNLGAQEKLSKKEIREIKKKKFLEDLESTIHSAQFRFGADKMLASTGNTSAARGGILYLRGDTGEFMEYWWVNQNDKKTMISTEFPIKNLNTTGNFNSGEIELNVVGDIKGKLWNFQFTIKPSKKAYLVLKNNSGTIIRYDGRISKL